MRRDHLEAAALFRASCIPQEVNNRHSSEDTCNNKNHSNRKWNTRRTPHRQHTRAADTAVTETVPVESGVVGMNADGDAAVGEGSRSAATRDIPLLMLLKTQPLPNGENVLCTLCTFLFSSFDF